MSKLTRRLSELSTWLYSDLFHLIKTLTMAVEDCGLRLGTVGMGTKDSDRRVVSVFGLSSPSRYILIGWTTTECGNIEASFSII